MTDTLAETDVTIDYAEVGSSTLLPNPNKTVDEFQTWLGKKRQNATWQDDEATKTYPLQHNWSHRKARRNFARSKDVDRHFWRTYDEFTTVLITRTADENTDPLLEQTEALTPKSYYQSRYRLLRRLSKDYACVSVYAPKYDLPNTERTVHTHVHTGVWLPGHVEPEAFDLLKDKHMATVPGATDCHISVRHHSSDTYPSRRERSGKDRARGATTALPYEVAAENQPLMNVETDAADLYDTRALEWCATLSAGGDDTHETAGMGYWKELGGFGQYADRVEDSLKRKTEKDYHRSLNNPYRSQRNETNQSHELDEPEPSPHGISQDARDGLIRGISQLAQVTTPDRRLEAPNIDSLRGSIRIIRDSANSRISES
ncbi:hypothetical protein ACOJIV_27375 [Haloarcula sp. AONF1]